MDAAGRAATRVEHTTMRADATSPVVNSTRYNASNPTVLSRDRSKADEPIRVVLVGNQVMVRAGLAHVLATHARLSVVAEGLASEAVRAVEIHAPHVLVLVEDLDVKDDLPLLAALRMACARTAVLVLRSRQDPDGDERALAAGARGVLLLEHPPALLLKAVEKVHAGELWLDRARTAGLLRGASGARHQSEQAATDHARIASLTRRELEIVQLTGAGLRSRGVADRLFISEATVRNHLTSILAKLGLADRFDLAVYAFRHGLVRFP